MVFLERSPFYIGGHQDRYYCIINRELSPDIVDAYHIMGYFHEV